MRRIAITTVAALALAMPGVALAHGGYQPHGNWKGSPTPAPEPAASAPAGTVESFEGETLTIKLANGSLVAGQVTEATHLLCVTPPSSEPPTSEPAPTPTPGSWAHSSDYGRGGHRGHWGHESWWHHGHHGRWHSYGHHGFPGGPYGGPGPWHGGSGSVQACETSALTQGATVLGAELHVGSEGATWQYVVLQS
ncbi:MAG TPA: hypothetical protein VGF95_15515 [Solirubrobacteraceae bacterium]|jgi:hypothetical protein